MNLDSGPNLVDGDASDPEDIEATLVYDGYRARVEAGHPPDPEKLLAEHPLLADRLRILIATNNLIAAVSGDEIPNFEDYRIVRVLGRGGMGIVYEADQVSRGRHVAIKVLTAAAAMDPQHLKRFLQVEVPAAKLLRHPHIVPIIDVGCEHGVYYYAMQFIDGQNLAQLTRAIPKPDGAGIAADDMASEFEVADNKDAISSPRSGSSRFPAGKDARDWYQDAARWGLQAAEALDFAHQQGVVHRDIKPSNLLLDNRSNVWITDFGLAHIQGEAHLTATGDLTGTPRYMSPEQVQSRRIVVDHRTDIYSLGATLYELLTLRPAFEGDSPQDVMRQVIQEEPTAPRRVNPEIPRDLETIVLKAMAKERDDRYDTAQALADDLRRFLDREPIHAQRPSPLDRASRWARQHRKVVATALALLLTTVVGLSVVVISIARAEKRAVAAEGLAEDHARESQYESLMQQVLRIRLTSHSTGWSSDAWRLVRDAAKLHPRDRGSFQSQAAAILMDLDAHLLAVIPVPASSLSFDPTGRRLWMGGLKQELRVWDNADQRIEARGPAIEGPIAFRADGTPLQLGMTRDANTGVSTLQLWDAARQSAKIITLPDGAAQIVAHAISPDGTYLGAVVEPAQGERNLLLWETATGRSRPPIRFPAVGLAFSPDASLVAAWDEAGKIVLWSLPEASLVAILPSGDTPIRCTAFGRARGLSAPITASERWLLAAGDAGGTVTVWDLKKRTPMNLCRGSEYDINALAFSPDGTTLASAGRYWARLWDVATGRFLLSLRLRNTMTALAFSPDGTRLAVGSRTAFGMAEGVDVYRVEEGRGIRTFRALRGLVPKTIFSPDGRLVAGLSQDWQVAIWDQASGQLRITLDVPQGPVADNSGLAFSPDSKRFAFSAGRQAKLWDVETGKELGVWPLPEGLQDTIAFRGPDQLFLLRRERTDVKVPLYSKENNRDHPRVMRLRNLMGEKPIEPIRVIADFNKVHHTAATPDGKYFVVEGVGGPGESTRSVNAYEASSGLRLWSLQSRKGLDAAAWFGFDPTGKVLRLEEVDGHVILLEMPSRAVLGSLAGDVRCLSPGARRWLGIDPVSPTARSLVVSIHELGLEPPLLQVAHNSSAFSVLNEFSPDGRHVIWGNGDGSVSICDLDEVQRRLAEVDLGW